MGITFTVGVYRNLIQLTSVNVTTPEGTDPNLEFTPVVWTATEVTDFVATINAGLWIPQYVTMTLTGVEAGTNTNGLLEGFEKQITTYGASSDF